MKNIDIYDMDSILATFSYCVDIKHLVLDSGIDTGHIVSMRELFSMLNGTEYIAISALDTKNVTNICDMFSGVQI